MRSRRKLYSFLLVPALLSMLGVETDPNAPDEVIQPTAAEAREPTRASPFVKPEKVPTAPAAKRPEPPATVKKPVPPASKEPAPPVAKKPPPAPKKPAPPVAKKPAPPVAKKPLPPGEKPSTGDGGAAPEGPPAKPPPPPPSGIRPQPIAPILKGPAIPVPKKKPENWGAEDWEEDDGSEKVVYAGVIGTIKDSVTKKPVKNVEISLPELDLRAISDSRGQFMIRGVRVREEPYEILFDVGSYKTKFERLRFDKKGNFQREFLITPLGW